MDVTIGVTLRKAAQNLANGDRVPLTLPAGSMRRTLYFNQLLSQVFPMNKSRPPFHLAVEARDIAEARVFYGGLLGCPEGRSADAWVDFNFFGHQLVCHLSDDYPGKRHDASSNPVDGHTVPVPHFGVVLEMAQWQSLAATLVAAAIEFVIEPYIRFQGEVGEQATMFFLDPSGNPLEFKAFQDVEGQLFEAG
jgi:extradiol dioxygenase family protein